MRGTSVSSYSWLAGAYALALVTAPAAIVLVYSPGTAEVTAIETVQEPFAGMVPPLNVNDVAAGNAELAASVSLAGPHGARVVPVVAGMRWDRLNGVGDERERGREPIRVGVLGARGRMGVEVCKAVDAAVDMELVAMIDQGDWLFNASDAAAEVVVDFTTPEVVMDNLHWCIDQGINVVVGTSGFTEQRLARVRSWLERKPDIGVVIAPNFAVGAVLMMEFAARAARFYESVEIIEQHHPDKVDAPSGTAVRTAQLVAGARSAAGLAAMPDATKDELAGAPGARGEGVPGHSGRGRGAVAHQRVPVGTGGRASGVAGVGGEVAEVHAVRPHCARARVDQAHEQRRDRGLPRPRRPRHEDDSVRMPDHAAPFLLVLFGEPELGVVLDEVLRVENAHHELFAESRGHG